MSEYRERKIYDVFRRNCLDDEAWEYIGSTTADDIDRAITNVRYKYHCGKRPGQYLSPLNRNHEDPFGWQWKAEEAASEPNTEEKEREEEMAIESNTPDEIMADLRRSMGIVDIEAKRFYTVKDKVVAAFLYMFYEELTEDGKAVHHMTQHKIAEFMGMDDSHVEDLMANDAIVSIATCLLEYCKQFDKWLGLMKLGSRTKEDVKYFTDKWLSALKKGTKK